MAFRIYVCLHSSGNAQRGGRKEVIDATGHKATDLLRAILIYFPVEEKDANPVMIMDRSDEDKTNNMAVRICGLFSSQIQSKIGL